MPSPKVVSERTLRNRAVRVELAYKALDEIDRGLADGLYAVANQILEDAQRLAPRDPEAAAARGVPMMADTGSVQGWSNGKRVLGTWAKRPKGASVPRKGAVAFVGFSSPLAHLIELGTVKMAAHPFLTPAAMKNVADIEPFVKAAVRARLASAPERAALSAAITAFRAGTGTGAEVGAAARAVRAVERPIRRFKA